MHGSVCSSVYQSLKRENISIATLKDKTRNEDVSDGREKAEILSKQYMREFS